MTCGSRRRQRRSGQAFSPAQLTPSELSRAFPGWEASGELEYGTGRLFDACRKSDGTEMHAMLWVLFFPDDRRGRTAYTWFMEETSKLISLRGESVIFTIDDRQSVEGEKGRTVYLRTQEALPLSLWQQRQDMTQERERQRKQNLAEALRLLGEETHALPAMEDTWVSSHGFFCLGPRFAAFHRQMRRRRGLATLLVATLLLLLLTAAFTGHFVQRATAGQSMGNSGVWQPDALSEPQGLREQATVQWPVHVPRSMDGVSLLDVNETYTIEGSASIGERWYRLEETTDMVTLHVLGPVAFAAYQLGAPSGSFESDSRERTHIFLTTENAWICFYDIPPGESVTLWFTPYTPSQE